MIFDSDQDLSKLQKTRDDPRSTDGTWHFADVVEYVRGQIKRINVGQMEPKISAAPATEAAEKYTRSEPSGCFLHAVAASVIDDSPALAQELRAAGCWPRRLSSGRRGGPAGCRSAARPARRCCGRRWRSRSARRGSWPRRRRRRPGRAARGLAFSSSILPCSRAALNTASRSTSYGLRRLISRPVGWAIAETCGFASASSIRLRDLLARLVLAVVDAGHDPVGLGQHVVGAGPARLSPGCRPRPP